MAEYGKIEEITTGHFSWDIDDVLSLKCVRSPPFEFRNTPLHLRLYVNERENRLELSIHSRVIPRERFQVQLEMDTADADDEEAETRTGILDSKGNFYIRQWMPWSEMLRRRLEILCNGRLTVGCKLTEGEKIFPKQVSTQEKENIGLKEEDTSKESDEEDTTNLPKCFMELQKAMKSLLISGENSDVTIKVQDKEFPAHRCILSMRCPAFQSMFKHDTAEKKTGVVDMDDCDPEIFPDFLTHLYTGIVSHITSKNVFGLYAISDKYLFGELKEACLSFMKLNIDCENFCTTLSLALRHDEKELLGVATEFFCGFSQKIIETQEWQIFLANNATAGNGLFREALMKKKS